MSLDVQGGTLAVSGGPSESVENRVRLRTISALTAASSAMPMKIEAVRQQAEAEFTHHRAAKK